MLSRVTSLEKGCSEALKKPRLLHSPRDSLGRFSPLKHLLNFGLTNRSRKRSPCSEAEDGMDEETGTTTSLPAPVLPLPSQRPYISWPHLCHFWGTQKLRVCACAALRRADGPLILHLYLWACTGNQPILNPSSVQRCTWNPLSSSHRKTWLISPVWDWLLNGKEANCACWIGGGQGEVVLEQPQN